MRTLSTILSLVFIVSCKTEFRKTIEKYPDGSISIEYIYPDKSDTKSFTYFAYYLNGQPLFQSKVVDMKFVDQKRNYYDNGKIESIETLAKPTSFDDSLYDCQIKKCRKDGTLIESYEYKNGKIDGLVNSYDSSGKLLETYQYRDGIRDGEMIGYFADGKIRSKGYYKNDTMFGYYYLFKQNGDTSKYCSHNKSGDIALPYKKWLDNGLVMTGNYINPEHTRALWQWFDKNNKEVKRKVTNETDVGLVAPE